MQEWFFQFGFTMARGPDWLQTTLWIAYALIAYYGAWWLQAWVRDRDAASPLSVRAATFVIFFVVLVGVFTVALCASSIVVTADPTYKARLDELSQAGRSLLVNFKYASLLSFGALALLVWRLWDHQRQLP